MERWSLSEFAVLKHSVWSNALIKNLPELLHVKNGVLYIDISVEFAFRSAHTAGASDITHERQPNFRHRKKKENRKIQRGEFITPPRPTSRRSNKGKLYLFPKKPKRAKFY